ncbi:MAG: hypothetical protein K8I00_02535 [Candidatus Omnitrophica bacterium]|nr:hypothetical protein [Candidatus Omnitrophota bacterium]
MSKINSKSIIITFSVFSAVVTTFLGCRMSAPSEENRFLAAYDKNNLLRVRKMNYFSESAFSANPERNEYYDGYLGLHLLSMKGESLYNKRTSKDTILCRFLVLPTFDYPIVFSIEINQKEKVGNMYVKRTDGAMGYPGESIIFNKQLRLTSSEINWFLDNIALLNKNLVNKDDQRGFVDGTMWNMEIVKNGRYSIQFGEFPDKGDISIIGRKIMQIAKSKLSINSKVFDYMLEPEDMDSPQIGTR